MSYKLSIERQDDVLWATATGTRSLETVLSMSYEILASCERHKVTKVLTDVRGLDGRLKAIESFELSENHFPKIRDRKLITHNAIVDLKRFEQDFRFFENVATNRGFNIALFSDPDSALKWLKR